MHQNGNDMTQFRSRSLMLPSPICPTAKRLFRRLPGIWASGLDLTLRRKYLHRNPTRLDVMTSFHGQNIDVVQVLLQSLSETHPCDSIVFWLLEQSVPAAQIQALPDFCAALGNVTLHAVRIPDAADFDRLKALGGKPDSARFLWFVAHQHLPKDMSRVIYLDASDIIVSDDLVPLLHHPFLGKYLVACRERPDLPPIMVGPARRAYEYGLPAAFVKYISRGLINSGAIVLNLDKFRRDGIGIGHYVETAEWAQDRLGLEFGDQGLFSLTHGSHYTRAHDRYNHRFHDESPKRIMQRPAVIHYAGRFLKPAFWRMTAEHEQLVTDHLHRTGSGVLYLDSRLQVRAAHLPYLRRWWEVCARTPSHARIAPLATQRMAAALTALGLEIQGR